MGISIHTLTLRVTETNRNIDAVRAISIHTLTLRVTVDVLPLVTNVSDFNPHPHTEGDMVRR